MNFIKILIEDLQVPYDRDPAMRSKWEILFNYPGVWAIVFYRFTHLLAQNNLRLPARFLAGIAQFLTGVDINPYSKIGRRVFIDHAFGVVIGETAIVGDDVTIYQQVTLGGVNLDKDKKRHPTIENGVVIGSGAKVLGDITIGENSKVGSNSVVVKSVPPNSTAIGLPARVVGKKDDCKETTKENLPDINKELFYYVIDRLKNLEAAVIRGDCEFIQYDKELEKKYEEFINSIDKK